MTTNASVRVALSGAVLTLIMATLAACEDQTPSADDLGTAEVALAASSIYGIDDDLHGRLVLLDAEGAARVVETSGLYFASVGTDGTRVHIADAENQVVVDEEGVQRIARQGRFDMEDWSGQAGRTRWTLFNVGTRGTADYLTGVVAIDDNRIVEGQIKGEVVGHTVCADQVHVAVGDWHKPRDPQGTSIRTLDTVRDDISEVGEQSLALPLRAHVVNLGCVDDEIVVIAQRGDELLLASEANDLEDPSSWSPVQTRRGDVVVAGDDILLGAVGKELFFFFPREGVKALDIRTGRSRQVVEFGESRVNTQVTLQGNKLVAFVSGGDEASVVQWLDPTTGKMTREIPAGEVDALLRLHDEAIDRGPIALDVN